MAKRNKKVSYNPIESITEDWGLDSRNQLPYSGESVQEFIKSSLNSKIGYRKISDERESDGFYHTRSFASKATYDKWVTTREDSLVLQDEILPDTHQQGASYIVNLETKSNTNKIVSLDGTVKLQLKYTSKKYNPIDSSTSHFDEVGTLIIEHRTSLVGSWSKVASISISSRPEDDLNYDEIDITKYLFNGNQQLRVKVIGESSQETTSYITFKDIVLTKLTLEYAYNWELAVNSNLIPLFYYISGAVDKILKIKFYNLDKSEYQEFTFDLGEAIYNEAPWSFNAEVSETFLQKGIHTIEAYIQVKNSDIVTDTVVSQIMLGRVNPGETYIAINDLVNTITNFDKVTVFKYAVFSTESSEYINIITKSTEELKNDGDRVTINTKLEYNTIYDIESDLSSIDATINLYKEQSKLSEIPVTISNKYRFTAVPNPDLFINPKVRSNNNGNRATIINHNGNRVIPASFTNFNFINDGWIEDEDKNKCLRVPRGSFLNINYEVFEEFKTNPRQSLTIELDVKTAQVLSYTDPSIRICSYQNNNPLGFELKPTEAVFMTANNKIYKDQDIAFQEGVRTHIAINIVNNLANLGKNYIRIFINGVINREIEYSNEDSFIGYVNNVLSSQGIRLGSNNSSLDLYSLKVYKKLLSADDIRKNWIASLSSIEDKIKYTKANNILSDNGTISYSKTKELYNCLVWTGHVPSYLNKSSKDNGGTLSIEIIGDNKHSGVINNLGIKGQGSSSKGYWKWNHQYKMNKDSVFLDKEGNKHKGYAIEDDCPEAVKLVTKLNWASSMQSHKMGETYAYNVLWKDIIKASGVHSVYPNAKVAIIQKPFFYFIKETPTSEPKFYAIVTFGPGKADKPTFGIDKKTLPDFLMLEGSDNGKPLTEMRVPWLRDEVTYSAEEEAYIYNNEVSWDYDGGDQDKLDYFINAQNFVVTHNTNILPYLGTYEQLVANKTLDKDIQYWITEPSGTHNKYDLFRWDYITNTWVNASTNKTSGKYDVFNINTQCGNIAVSNNTASNTKFKEWRSRDFKQNLSTYYDIQDLLFTMSEMKKIAASDNRCKNIYPYLDPISHLIRWYQDDVDTIINADNVGRKNKPYYVEEHDIDNLGNNYWNGANHVLFNLVEETYANELKAMMKKILTSMAKLGGSITGFMQKYFFSTQEYFPAVAYNETAKLLYEEASKAMSDGKYSNATPPITQSLGDQLQAEKQWWKQREVYMSSYASYGEFDVRGPGSLMFRSIPTTNGSNPTFNFKVTPAMWLYVQGGVGQTLFGGIRTKAGETTDLYNLMADGNTDVFINGINYIKNVQGLREASLGEVFTLSSASMTKFNIDNILENTTQFRPSSMILNLPVVDTIEINNITTVQGTLDLRKSVLVRNISLISSPFSTVLLPESNNLTSLLMPNTIEKVSLKNLINLANSQSNKTFVQDFNKVHTLEIDNCPKINLVMYLEEALKQSKRLQNITLNKVNMIDVTPTLLNSLLKYNVSITGRIKVLGNIDYSLKYALMQKFGNIDDVNNSLYVDYSKVEIRTVSTSKVLYINKVGQTRLLFKALPVEGNNIKSVTYTMTPNRYATINNDGIITTTLIGNKVDNPSTTVTTTLTTLDNKVVTALTTVYFYTRDAEVGDIVYYDGTYTSPENIDNTKTPIGLCFYVNPENPLDRRMVALDSVSYKLGENYIMWGGLLKSANNNINITLQDDPTYDTGVPIDAILNNKQYNAFYNLGNGIYNTSLSPEQKDKDGFKIGGLNDNCYMGNYTIHIEEGIDKYKKGDSIPLGLYNTLIFIRHRNKIFRDSGINIPIPRATSTESELEVLRKNYLKYATNLGSVTSEESIVKLSLYYIIFSYAYAYEPAVKDDEVLNNKFKAHNWWVPSSGESLRLVYYGSIQSGKPANHNIFQIALNAGLNISKYQGISSVPVPSQTPPYNEYRIVNRDYSKNNFKGLLYWNSLLNPAHSYENQFNAYGNHQAQPVCSF